jgi:hypothetical protein
MWNNSCKGKKEISINLVLLLNSLIALTLANVPNVSVLARILGCKVLPLPIKFLGLLFCAPFKAKFTWDTIIEKMERRLSRWKRLLI